MPVKMEMKGLNELLAALRKVAPEAKREFTAELRTIGKMVAEDAAAEMPKRSGKARRSVKVKIVTRKGFEGVQVVEGGSVAPYAPWLDFGGTVGRGRKSTARVTIHGSGKVTVKRLGSTGTGSVTRPFIRDGRYLYPAYFRRYDDMVKATTEAVRKAANAAGLKATTT